MVAGRAEERRHSSGEWRGEGGWEEGIEVSWMDEHELRGSQCFRGRHKSTNYSTNSSVLPVEAVPDLPGPAQAQMAPFKI